MTEQAEPVCSRAHGFTQALLDCFQGQLQPSHRLSKMAEPALNTRAPCLVRRFGDQMDQGNIYVWHDESTKKKIADMRILSARAAP